MQPQVGSVAVAQQTLLQADAIDCRSRIHPRQLCAEALEPMRGQVRQLCTASQQNCTAALARSHLSNKMCSCLLSSMKCSAVLNKQSTSPLALVPEQARASKQIHQARPSFVRVVLKTRLVRQTCPTLLDLGLGLVAPSNREFMGCHYLYLPTVTQARG